MMANLLQETLEEMSDEGKGKSDVLFIGSRSGDYQMTWDEFVALADREYDSGFGGQEVAADLVVVFVDRTWIERHEYDGSEWWEYKAPPPVKVAPSPKPIQCLFAEVGWNSIEDIQERSY